MAFKIAGSMASSRRREPTRPARADRGVTSRPRGRVGDVVGDLNSRRGRPLGMEPKGSMTEIKAEVPMAEVLDYAPDLRAITGGRGDYTMEFERYEEVPGHMRRRMVGRGGARRRLEKVRG
jgi:elongation factor G